MRGSRPSREPARAALRAEHCESRRDCTCAQLQTLNVEAAVLLRRARFVLRRGLIGLGPVETMAEGVRLAFRSVSVGCP
jgi:hypothetical protein